ncbi:MAG: hypothetical protein NC821_04575, partial [Candidatus Omnitrophica bacterium]|nr:hypothetical protein [Candidatus Omnitrophota bacterium]
VQRDFYESASLKRSRTFNIKNTTFNFYKPGLTPTQVKAKLEATAEPLSGYDTNHQGKGLVRADLAVQ